MVADWVCSVGVTLVEIPAASPDLHAQLDGDPLPVRRLCKTALLSQVQQVIPLIKIQPLQSRVSRDLSLRPALHGRRRSSTRRA